MAGRYSSKNKKERSLRPSTSRRQPLNVKPLTRSSSSRFPIYPRGTNSIDHLLCSLCCSATRACRRRAGKMEGVHRGRRHCMQYVRCARISPLIFVQYFAGERPDLLLRWCLIYHRASFYSILPCLLPSGTVIKHPRSESLDSYSQSLNSAHTLQTQARAPGLRADQTNKSTC